MGAVIVIALFNDIFLKCIPIRSCILLVVFILAFNDTATADWQSTLESQFDIVETFDELADWVPPDANAVDSKFDPIMNKMPVKVASKAPQWSFYSVGGSVVRDYSGTVKWIANHGAGNVLRGTGKSLIIDYGDITGNGPQRMAFMIGDSPDDGYISTVYMFLWLKYNKGFFPYEPNDYLGGGWYNKVFQISSGFRGVYKWGTQTEYDFLDPAGGNSNLQHDYGENYSVFDIVSGQASYGDYPQIGIFGRIPDIDCYGIDPIVENQLNHNISLQQKIINGEWFAIEVCIVKSTPGQSNGSYTEWAYNQDGSLIGTYTLDNVKTFDNCQTFTYNHGYNKFLIGGNRGAFGTPIGTFIQRADGYNATESHLYVDDIIVHGNRIGPTYFTLVNSGFKAFLGNSGRTHKVGTGGASLKTR